MRVPSPKSNVRPITLKAQVTKLVNDLITYDCGFDIASFVVPLLVLRRIDDCRIHFYQRLNQQYNIKNCTDWTIYAVVAESNRHDQVLLQNFIEYVKGFDAKAIAPFIHKEELIYKAARLAEKCVLSEVLSLVVYPRVDAFSRLPKVAQTVVTFFKEFINAGIYLLIKKIEIERLYAPKPRVQKIQGLRLNKAFELFKELNNRVLDGYIADEEKADVCAALVFLRRVQDVYSSGRAIGFEAADEFLVNRLNHVVNGHFQEFKDTMYQFLRSLSTNVRLEGLHYFNLQSHIDRLSNYSRLQFLFKYAFGYDFPFTALPTDVDCTVTDCLLTACQLVRDVFADLRFPLSERVATFYETFIKDAEISISDDDDEDASDFLPSLQDASKDPRLVPIDPSSPFKIDLERLRPKLDAKLPPKPAPPAENPEPVEPSKPIATPDNDDQPDQSEPAPQSTDAFVPHTPLGERLLSLRNQAIESGMPLLTADEVLEEVERRREDCENFEEPEQSVSQALKPISIPSQVLKLSQAVQAIASRLTPPAPVVESPVPQESESLDYLSLACVDGGIINDLEEPENNNTAEAVPQPPSACYYFTSGQPFPYLRLYHDGSPVLNLSPYVYVQPSVTSQNHEPNEPPLVEPATNATTADVVTTIEIVSEQKLPVVTATKVATSLLKFGIDTIKYFTSTEVSRGPP